MLRSSSGETAKPPKRKRTRSVSDLTPAQQARKRTWDREAQRAIRARTKEHIERLERELAELKGVQSRDRKVQELLRRNKILEEEVARLRERLSYTTTESSYSSNAAGTPSAMINNACDLLFGQLTPSLSLYDGDISSSSAAVLSPIISALPSGDFRYMADNAQQSYGHITGAASEPWPATIPPDLVPGNILGPSSPAYGEESNVGYILTSAPMSMMPSSLQEIEQDNDEIGDNRGPRLSTPAVHMQQQHWYQHPHSQPHPQHQPRYQPQSQQASPPPQPQLHSYAHQKPSTSAPCTRRGASHPAAAAKSVEQPVLGE